jgi:hypothetical protein
LETLKGKKGVFESILGESHSAGLLSNTLDIDMLSGMEKEGKEEDFLALLKAHVRKTSMKNFISGDELKKSKSKLVEFDDEFDLDVLT